MKVVILHQHFNNPEVGGAIRSWYLAQALVQKRISVIVITGHNEKNYSVTMVDGIEVHSLPVAYDNKFGFSERSSSFLQFVWKSVKLFAKLSDVNVVYAISVPLTIGIAAMWIKRKYRIPYIFEVGDLWPEAPIQMDFVKNILLQKSLYALERRVYKSADSIVALSTAIQSNIAARVPGKTIHLIPNMADCDFFRPTQKEPSLETRFNVAGKLVVSYIGAMGLANGLDYFVEIANTCRKQNLPVHFILCGEGAVREKLKGHADHLMLHNVTFINLQNRNGVKDILNITDATFVCYKNLPVLETGSPNKFFDGLAAGKLIIVNMKGWIRDEIELRQCGIYVNPQQPLDFADKIRAFIANPEKLNQYQQASRKLAEEKYSRKALSQEFVQLFS